MVSLKNNQMIAYSSDWLSKLAFLLVEAMKISYLS